MKKWLITQIVTQVLFLQATIFQYTAEVLMCTCHHTDNLDIPVLIVHQISKN